MTVTIHQQRDGRFFAAENGRVLMRNMPDDAARRYKAKADMDDWSKSQSEQPSICSMHHTFEHVVHEVVSALANDTEGKIRQALIDHGWTPPPKDSI